MTKQDYTNDEVYLEDVGTLEDAYGSGDITEDEFKRGVTNARKRAAYRANKVAKVAGNALVITVTTRGSKTLPAGTYSVAAEGFKTRRQARKHRNSLNVAEADAYAVSKRGKGDYVVVRLPA